MPLLSTNCFRPVSAGAFRMTVHIDDSHTVWSAPTCTPAPLKRRVTAGSNVALRFTLGAST